MKIISNKKLNNMRNIRDIQGTDGNWNVDDYSLGMFNGIELRSF